MPANSTGTPSVLVPVIGKTSYAFSPADDFAALQQIPTGGTVLLLPADPSAGDAYGFGDVDGSCSSTSPITLEAQGATIRGADTFVLRDAFSAGRARFDGAGQAWALESLAEAAGELAFAPVVASSTPVQIEAGESIPCDCRSVPIFLLAPVDPVGGAVFEVIDVYGAAGGPFPITVTAEGSGVTIQNPSWDGSGSPLAAAAVLSTALQNTKWRYNSQLSAWLIAGG